jgi:glucokinase
MIRRFAIGTDIGGSHISCALVDMIERKVIKDSHFEQKIDNKASSNDILNGWKSVIGATIAKAGIENVAGIGFAMPGPFNYPEGIAMFTKDVAKYENMYQIHVANELAVRLNLQPDQFRFMNDASAFAIGEAWMGAAANSSQNISITLGTGFGSAFIDKGLPVVEGEKVPQQGCVWHLPFKDGIADDYFSTRWYIKRWNEVAGITVSGVKPIADLATTDDRAKKLFIEAGENLGTFLGPWLKKFGAEVLVIGGNVSGAYNLFGPTFETSLKTQGINTQIHLSKLMEDAAMVGSARMFEEDYWNKIKPLLSKM